MSHIPLRRRRRPAAAPLNQLRQIQAQHAEITALRAEVVGLRDENARLREQVVVDPLTGLFNRRGMRSIWAMWFRDNLAQQTSAVALLDLDLFKPINDALGHKAGDVVLCRLANIIRSLQLTGVRYGGDEFVVFLPPSRRATDDPIGVVKALADRLAEPITLRVGDRAEEVQITMSVGVAAVDEHRYTDPDGWLDELIRSADLRLYEAKASGRARIVGPARIGFWR